MADNPNEKAHAGSKKNPRRFGNGEDSLDL